MRRVNPDFVRCLQIDEPTSPPCPATKTVDARSSGASGVIIYILVWSGFLAVAALGWRSPTTQPAGRTLSNEERAALADADILVVLPTLGDRIDTLRLTLETIAEQRRDVALNIALVAPTSAVDARQLAAQYGAIVMDDPRQGISAAINLGLAARTTERFYAWIGDDDLFRPGGLITLRRLLDGEDRAVVAFGGCDYIDHAGRTITTNNAGWLALFLLPWGPDLVPHPGSLIRLDSLEAIGQFDPDLRFAMDLDAFLKLRQLGSFVWTRGSVSAFRWHVESLTVANRAKSSAEADSVKRRHLPRWLRPMCPLWHAPVRWAAALAAQSMSARASSIDGR